MMIGRHIEVCKRKSQKINKAKSKVMFGGEEGSVYELIVDGRQFEDVSECKYLGFVLDRSGTDGAECCRKVVGPIRSLVNARNLQFECARVLREGFLVPFLLHGS